MVTVQNKKECPCFKYEERAAIIEYVGRMERDTAEYNARLDTCKGCTGFKGVGLFEMGKTKTERK